MLLWFFLNLCVLGAVTVFLLQTHFNPLGDWRLPPASRERIQSMSQLLVDELRNSAPSKWDAVLARFGQAYRMDFSLLRPDGIALAGPHQEWPEGVRRLLTPGSEERPGPPPQQRLDRPAAPQFGPPGPRPEDAARSDPPHPPGNFPQFLVQTANPLAFWLLVRLPPEGLAPPGVQPVTLVGVTHTLAGGTLLFDPVPWMLAAAGLLLFSVLFWLPLARSVTRVIARMTQATEAIAEGHFDVHLSELRLDELGRLSSAINRLASRLAGFVTGQKRFLGDVAHELCSPLARMEMALSILEQRADERCGRYVDDVREEVRHMSTLVNELLSFSKASLGGNQIKLRSIRVYDVVQAAVRREKIEEADIGIEVPEDLAAEADPELLRRALANLVRNAIRYAMKAGPITVTAGQDGKKIWIRVRDCGPGVPAAALDKLFDPFYRVDQARTRETGGVGLGMAIVKSCIDACGGTVAAENGRPEGLVVTICLEKARSPIPRTDFAR